MSRYKFFSADKAERYTQRADSIVLSEKVYNLVIGGVTAYGLLLNFIICKFFSGYFDDFDPISLLLGYLVLAVAGVIIVHKSHSSVISFVGYNMVVVPMGIMLSTCLRAFPSIIITQVAGLTLSVVVIMICLSILFPDFFIRLGGPLLASLFSLLVLGGISTLLGLHMHFYSYISATIFSLYIAYDWARANRYQKNLDNAVDSACDIYLDIINLFLNILKIVSSRN